MECTNGNYIVEEQVENEHDNLEKTEASYCEMPVNFDIDTGMKANFHMNNDHNVMGEESETSNLLSTFKKLHQKRIIGVENFSGISEDDKNKEMLHILRQYVDQLEEQNDVLMTTMMELEAEAHQRVIQMEKRLNSSAKSTMEAVINLNECEKEMRKLVTERLEMESVLDDIHHQVSSLKIENNFLRDQNFNLNHDIQALLQIIQHARTTGHWEMNCVTFCEVTPEQVFGPVQSISQHYPESTEYCSELLETVENKQKSSQRTLQSCFSSSGSPPSTLTQINGGFSNLQWSQEDISNKLLEKEKAISNLQSQLTQIEHELIKGEENQCYSQEEKSTRLQNQFSSCKENDGPIIIDKPFSDNLSEGHMLLQKCLSLPVIDDFMHFNIDTQKSFLQAELATSQKKYLSMMEIRYLGQLKNKRVKTEGSEGKWPCKPVQLKFDYGPNFRQVYSEPLLFIYGNSICVYRPCEPLDKELIILSEDFNHGIPPCQSIDLKIPPEENDLNLRVCEWDHIRNPQEFSTFERSLCLPCQRTISKNSCSSSDSDETCCSRDLPLKTEIINLNQEEFSLGNHSHTYPKMLHLCENSVSLKEQEKQNKSYISRSIQAVDNNLNHFSVGIQVDFGKEASNSVKHSLIENGYAVTDVEEINRTLQKIKENSLRTEDKVAAKEILIKQLQNHLQTAMKQVEMKDVALENVEKKLGVSRNENDRLKVQITTIQHGIEKLLKELEDARMLQDNLQLNVEARKEQIEEFRAQEQILQNQKRSLMIQLDARGDQLENARSELMVLKEDIKIFKIQVEQQTVIIKTLQDAVVQSKRALDVVRQTPQLNTQITPNNNLQLQSKPIHSSKSSVVDI